MRLKFSENLFSILFGYYSMRQNQHIDHTNSRVIEQTPVKQNAPPGGLNNVRDSRAQGSGSGGNYRTSDTSSAVSADSFFYFNLCSCRRY